MKSIYTVQKSNFNEIRSIWANQLWPSRQSPIEPTSWINERGEIDASVAKFEAFFWKIEEAAGEIAGVLSGHATSVKSFRSRGLWVREDLRRQGLAHSLMRVLTSEAKLGGFEKVWTMPRRVSWPFYESFGFRKITELNQYEYGPHYLAEFDLTRLD